MLIMNMDPIVTMAMSTRMVAKAKKETGFFCTSCGNSQQRWMGRCPGCQEWNTLVEETRVTGKSKGSFSSSSADRSDNKATPITDVKTEHVARIKIGVDELDRVLGGGLVPNGVSLLSGDPGIGKSTLLLTMASKLAQNGATVLYVSAEESITQSRMTAERLGAVHERLYLLAETDLSVALAEADRIKPSLLILDSVQTLSAPELESAPGSVSQVREVTSQVVRLAKSTNMCAFLVGHVTKDGNIAGPRLLEHMVDTVLYFEATRTGSHRILRAHKNRFGSTNEIGVFEMRGDGLCEVPNPSAFFLAERPVGKSGSAVAIAIEGTRPLLVEVQALCVPSLFGNPRRTTLGIDSTRCALLAAVLERRAGLVLSGQDLFVNVAGGANLTEPAADLPVALAIASSLTNKPIQRHLACFGEIGLSGELRGVSKIESRLKEAHQLGFSRVLLPKTGLERIPVPKGMELMAISSLEDAIDLALGEFSSE